MQKDKNHTMRQEHKKVQTKQISRQPKLDSIQMLCDRDGRISWTTAIVSAAVVAGRQARASTRRGQSAADESPQTQRAADEWSAATTQDQQRQT
jgi:hypothetical protein